MKEYLKDILVIAILAIIRPGAFIEGSRTGKYRHGFPGSDRTSSLTISRPDVADFILKQLSDDTYLGKTASLSY